MFIRGNIVVQTLRTQVTSERGSLSVISHVSNLLLALNECVLVCVVVSSWQT